MTASTSSTSTRSWTRSNLKYLPEAIFVAGALATLAFAHSTESVRTLSLVFTSIVLESLPFVLLGSLVGGIVEVFLSRETMARFVPKSPWKAALVAACLGAIFPICECAVVPVVRRLARKGFPLSAVIAYLLAGPIVNPIVAASTFLAYQFNWTPVLLRLVLGYAIAVTVGCLMGRFFPGTSWSAEDKLENEDSAHDVSCLHCHADHECGDSVHGAGSRVAAIFRHASEDFLSIAHYLVIGAFIAALAQTYLSRSSFLAFSSLPVLSTILMMLLAVLLNLCSEADAFIASSFRNLVPPSAQMAFLLLGPMFDLKLLLMYQTFFRRRTILVLVSLVVGLVFLSAVGLEVAGVMTP